MSDDETKHEIPTEMLLAANKEPAITGRVHPKNRNIHRVPIMCDGRVVGFYTPHTAVNGRQRIGPVYVAPEYRGRGLVRRVYAGIEGPMMAAVLDTNTDSIRMHERAGFVRWRRFARGWYYRRG